MTLNGAIMQLVEIRNHPMRPVIFKPALNKVIETISELEEKLIETISEPEEEPRPSKEVTTVVDHAIPDESISRQRAVAVVKEPVTPMYTWTATSIKEIETAFSLVKSITKQVQDAIAGRIEQLPPRTAWHELGTGCISRQAAIDIISQHTFYNDYDDTDKCSLMDGLRALPPAQPEIDILAWLLAYHTKSFELRGRYLPHEVIGWLIADFRKQYMSEGNENKEGPC